MTDREILFAYRFTEAEETLADARMMQEAGVSARSVADKLLGAIKALVETSQAD